MIILHMPDLRCSICARQLTGRQRRFCSRHCKNADTNNRHQNYLAQSARGLARKLAYIQASGGKCTLCGYSRNVAALAWHHRDPASKSFELDLRNLSNRSEASLERELEKCDLICCNCHAEVHYPRLMQAGGAHVS
jgi:hypothetical protein